MIYNPYDSDKYPSRKSPRLKNYDYTASNVYFVTICTHEKRCIFGDPSQLNSYGQIVYQGIRNIPIHYPDVKIEHFVVMPNHVHMLLYLKGKQISLSQVIGTWKAYVTRQIHKKDPELIIWQSSFHDHIVRDEKGYQNIWQYIEGNPMNWEKDCFYIK